MNITKVELYKTDRGNLVGNGWVTFDDLIDIRVAVFSSRTGGYFASLPSQRVVKDGETKYYPEVRINEELKKQLDTMVTKWYNEGRKSPPRNEASNAQKAKPSAPSMSDTVGDFLPDW